MCVFFNLLPVSSWGSCLSLFCVAATSIRLLGAGDLGRDGVFGLENVGGRQAGRHAGCCNVCLRSATVWLCMLMCSAVVELVYTSPCIMPCQIGAMHVLQGLRIAMDFSDSCNAGEMAQRSAVRLGLHNALGLAAAAAGSHAAPLPHCLKTAGLNCNNKHALYNTDDSTQQGTGHGANAKQRMTKPRRPPLTLFSHVAGRQGGEQQQPGYKQLCNTTCDIRDSLENLSADIQTGPPAGCAGLHWQDIKLPQ